MLWYQRRDTKKIFWTCSEMSLYNRSCYNFSYLIVGFGSTTVQLLKFWIRLNTPLEKTFQHMQKPLVMFKQIVEYMVQLSSKVTIAHTSDVPCRYSRCILHAFQMLHVHFLDASCVDKFRACPRCVLHVFQIHVQGAFGMCANITLELSSTACLNNQINLAVLINAASRWYVASKGKVPGLISAWLYYLGWPDYHAPLLHVSTHLYSFL